MRTQLSFHGEITKKYLHVSGYPSYHSRLHSLDNSVSDCRSRGHKLESQIGHIILMEIDHEIISMIILPILLIQEGQLSVTGASMCTSTGPGCSKRR